MAEYLAIFKREARKRYDAGMRPGKPPRKSHWANTTIGSALETAWS